MPAGALPSPAPAGTVGETVTDSPGGTAVVSPPTERGEDGDDTAVVDVVDAVPLEGVGVVDDEVVVVGAVVVVGLVGARSSDGAVVAGVVSGAVGLEPSA